MKYIFWFLLFFTFVPNLSAQNAVFFGSTEEDKGNSIFSFEDRFYIIGTTRKSNKSSTDYYLLEINENGSLKNKFIFGGPHGDYGKDIIVNSEGIFILGKTWDGGYPNFDMFLHNLSVDGNLRWSKFYGGAANDLGQKFIKTKDGGFAMVGHNRSLDDLGDVYIVKANKEGEEIWENHFGGRYVDHGFDVIENELGEFIIVGTLGGFYNPTTFDYLNHDADIYIIKTNSNGEEIWKKTFGGTSHDWAKKIIKAPEGGYFICGSTQSEGAGSFDMFLMKMDEDGNQLWIKTYGGNDFEYGESVQLTADNNLLLLGTSASFSGNFKPDHFLVKTDLDGDVIWENTFGGEGSDYSSSMVCTSDSGCVFTGWSNPGDMGKTDVVLYKISKSGDPLLLSSILPINDTIEQIKIFPNPVRNRFSVIIDTKSTTEFSIELYNSQGALVYKDVVLPNIESLYQPKLSSGLYMFTIQNNRQVLKSGKLVFK